MQLSISTNFPQIEAQLKRLQDDIGGRALVSAVNKTIDQARVQMQREIAAEFNVSSGFVRERLRVRRASAKGVTIEATLSGGRSDRRRSMNIIHFVEKSVSLAAARRRAKAGTLRALHVKIKRKGGTKPIAGAFIGNKGRTVFVREPDAADMASRPGRSTKHNQGIFPVQVIEIAQMFNTRRINKAVVDKILAKFPEIFAREVRFFTERFKA